MQSELPGENKVNDYMLRDLITRSCLLLKQDEQSLNFCQIKYKPSYFSDLRVFGDDTLSIQKIEYDSRNLSGRSQTEVLFVAIRGESRDAYDFFEESWRKGQRFYLISSEHLPSICKFFTCTVDELSDILQKRQALIMLHEEVRFFMSYLCRAVKLLQEENLQSKSQLYVKTPLSDIAQKTPDIDKIVVSGAGADSVAGSLYKLVLNCPALQKNLSMTAILNELNLNCAFFHVQGKTSIFNEKKSDILHKNFYYTHLDLQSPDFLKIDGDLVYYLEQNFEQLYQDDKNILYFFPDTFRILKQGQLVAENIKLLIATDDFNDVFYGKDEYFLRLLLLSKAENLICYSSDRQITDIIKMREKLQKPYIIIDDWTEEGERTTALTINLNKHQFCRAVIRIEKIIFTDFNFKYDIKIILRNRQMLLQDFIIVQVSDFTAKKYLISLAYYINYFLNENQTSLLEKPKIEILCREILNKSTVIEGKHELLKLQDDKMIILDSAWNSQQLENLLQSLKIIHRYYHLYIILSCSGNRASSLRKNLSRSLWKNINTEDRVYLTISDPRSEDGVKVLADMEEVFVKNDVNQIIKRQSYVDRKEAIKQAICDCMADEKTACLLILGRGDEFYYLQAQDSGKFNDKDIVNEILKEGK